MQTENIKVLFKHLGGSHLYGLNNAESDIDHRFVFMNTDINSILGLNRYDSVVKINESEDLVGFEIRHFLNMLRKGNTQCLETLWSYENPDVIIEKDAGFDLILNNKNKLVDPDRLYKSLKGYIFGERRLAMGERTGLLGGKRKASLEKYGFSHRNFAHLLRLCQSGMNFFNCGNFTINYKKFSPQTFDLMYQIKNEPEKFTAQYLKELSETYEAWLDKSYVESKAKDDFTFDENVANDILHKLYKPYI